MIQSGYEKTLRGHYLDLTHEGHRAWMRENNPQRWDERTWRAYGVRLGTDAGFQRRAVEAAQDRHRWTDEHVATAIGDRRVSGDVRMDFRRDLMREAFEKFPRPDPFENGWELPEHADPITGLVSSRAIPRARRLRSSAPLRSNPIEYDDSKGIEAARAANAARPAEPSARSWS